MKWIRDFDPDQERDERGRWTSGGGSASSEKKEGGSPFQGMEVAHPGKGYSENATVDKSGKIHTSDVSDAVLALHEGKKVELNQPREASTLIAKLGEIAQDMVNKGEKAPTFNLCNVSVAGTNLFCAESKGIERVKMPQLTDEQTKNFQTDLADKGFKVEKTSELASHLRATQDELNGAKVASAATLIEKNESYANRSIIVSKDNYILDGHHFWAGKLAIDLKNNVLGDDTKMNVARIDIGIIDLLEHAERFTEGKGKKGVEESTTKKDHAMANLIDRKFLIDNHKCPECDGTGEDEDGEDCPKCNGDGYLEDSKKTDDGVLKTVHLIDNAVIDGRVRKTKDGYLVADARIARTGIQLYSGDELGVPHMKTVRVYRSPREVFNRAAMASLANLPVTLGHPREMVDASNWEKYSVGHLGEEPLRDGDSVRIPLTIMDSKAIEAYERYGVKQTSVGYTTDLKWGQGRTPSGETYDAKQTVIRGNHLAVVPAARGGSLLRIGDDSNGGTDMPVKILIDGQTIEFADDLTAKHVQSHISALTKRLADADGAMSKSKADKEQEEEKRLRAEKDAATKDGEVTALRKQLEDATAKASGKVLDQLVKDRMDLMLKARVAMDGKIDFEGKETVEIHRAVAAAHLGDDLVKTMDANQLEGAFKAITSKITASKGVDKLADSLSLLNAGGGGDNTPKALKDAAYAKYVSNMQSAWKTPRAQ